MKTTNSHPFCNPDFLKQISHDYGLANTTIPLATYLATPGTKNRGQGSDNLNSHLEQHIIQINGQQKIVSTVELNELMDNVYIEYIGLHSIGNDPFQRISCVVQGFNSQKPNTGFERPLITEGPHMILGVYAYDSRGQLHIFRTIQLRQGRAMIDTFRGFTPLSEGHYDLTPESLLTHVTKNVTKILKEEGGDKFLIKKFHIIGKDVVNSSFTNVSSTSLKLAVEIDYEEFTRLSQVVSSSEATRRHEQLLHEGLTSIIINMSLDEYLAYKNDLEIRKDMTADSVTDWIALMLPKTK